MNCGAAHRVAEDPIARQKIPDDAADDGAAVNADAHVEPGQMESDSNLWRGLAHQAGSKESERKIKKKNVDIGVGTWARDQQAYQKNGGSKASSSQSRVRAPSPQKESSATRLDELKRQAGEDLHVVVNWRARD